MREHALPRIRLGYRRFHQGPIGRDERKIMESMATLVTSRETTIPATVLMIDDNEDELKYWSDSLRKTPSHYTVLESSNAAAGLELCGSRTIDCVILDLDMPESGFHVLLELVPDRHRPKLAVIVLTHLPHPNLFEMAKHNGAQLCLLKQSTSIQALDEAIQQAVAAVRAERSVS